MITDFETYKEVYDHLEKDHEKIKYRVDYYLPKAIKEFQKATTFPACKWYEYECPKSKNKYIIFFYSENKNQISAPRKGCFLDVKIENKPFDFYDTACRFFARNYEFMPIEVTEGINEKVAKYGDNGKGAFRVKDGICFTESWLEGLFNEDGDKSKDIIDAMVFVMTTFVPEFQMTDKQRLAIEKEHWEKWHNIYYDFMKEAKDGELMLRLNH